jgi:hypothetical protein
MFGAGTHALTPTRRKIKQNEASSKHENLRKFYRTAVNFLHILMLNQNVDKYTPRKTLPYPIMDIGT